MQVGGGAGPHAPQCPRASPSGTRLYRAGQLSLCLCAAGWRWPSCHLTRGAPFLPSAAGPDPAYTAASRTCSP